ncbi:MAG: hypothetical protein JSR17_06410 [Proteobacteria bacterium]|nr:hypothetical protein [Pseudomonadota bacterium]
MQLLSYAAILAWQAHGASHALMRGYPFAVCALIFFVPIFGPALYFAYEVGPTLYDGLKRKYRSFLAKRHSPFKELIHLQRQVKTHPTLENQQRLAKIYYQIGQFNEAIVLMDNLLAQKVFSTCPYLLLDKAHAYFAMEEFNHALATLNFMFDHNTDFESPHAQLLLARTLSAIGEWQKANREFERLESRYHGLEASFYYLQHLRKLKNLSRATELLKHMRHRYQRLPQHYRSSQKAWLKQAEREQS